MNDCFAVNGVHVVEGSNGLFVAMPNGRDKEGNYRDVCFPTTAELRHQINKAVLDGYHAALEKTPPEKTSVGEQLKDAERQSKAKPAKENAAPDKDAR
ncbi:SpoVG family protein [Christensenellaceae bacterium OttesenSCG-928-L17]|nr:SpoVG family protein [Christensenellaceae bacterium OttesenSCG-928-L17]